MKRQDSFDDGTLSLPGKLSRKLSYDKVSENLIKGSWLDILSGYNYSVQRKHLNDPRFSKLVALDLKLNSKNHSNRIVLKEIILDEKIDFPSENFDNITIVDGLEHLWKPQEILNESFRILKKDGVLQIIVPTWAGKPLLEWYAFVKKDQQASIEMDDHKMYYDEKTLWPMLIKAGFKPRQIRLKRIKFYFSLYAKATKTSG